MILYFVLIGFVAGGAGAIAVLAAGGAVWLAVLAYSFAGALGVLLSALIVAVAPTFPRPRGGLPVPAHPVRARSPGPARPSRARPVRTPRHGRVHAQATRR